MSDIPEKVYDQFVVENYYGGASEPITPEFFKEVWGEMSDAEKAGLVERAEDHIIRGED